MLNCNIVVSEFEPHSHLHSRMDKYTHEKLEPPNPHQAMGYIVSPQFFYKDSLGIK